jgi:hypothetical protein
MEAWCGYTPTKFHPRSEPGAVERQRIPQRQRNPVLGPATSQWPGFPKRTLIVNPRRRVAERRGSRPRVRRVFTTNPCRDQASSGVGWRTLRLVSRLGSRGVLMGKQPIISTTRRTRKRETQTSLTRSPTDSSQGIECSSKRRSPTLHGGPLRRSSAVSARMQSSRTFTSSSNIAIPQRCTPW